MMSIPGYCIPIKVQKVSRFSYFYPKPLKRGLNRHFSSEIVHNCGMSIRLAYFSSVAVMRIVPITTDKANRTAIA